MVEAATQYNLCSSKTDPIQVSDDSQFLFYILKQRHSTVQVSNSNSASSADEETNILNYRDVVSSSSVVSDKQQYNCFTRRDQCTTVGTSGNVSSTQ